MDIAEILETLQEADRYLQNNTETRDSEADGALLQNIDTLTDMLLQHLQSLGISSPAFDRTAYASSIQNRVYTPILKNWISVVSALLPNRYRNAVDAQFDRLVMSLSKASKDALTAMLRQNYAEWLNSATPQLRQLVILNHNGIRFWGMLDPESDIYEVADQRAACLSDHLEDIVALYESLCDYRSRKTLLLLLMYWITFDYEPINRMQERQFDAYFDLDIMLCDESEVFVDGGSYVGDSVMSYIKSYGAENYRRIYCYDVVKEHIERAKTNLEEYDNIVYRALAIGQKSGTMYISDQESESASIQETGSFEVPVVTLDDDIAEPVTFIKMDLEGGEYNALLGSEQHIRQDRPKLAICLYHSNEDLWRLPKLIRSFCPHYRFYLRFNSRGPENPNPFPFISDYVLLCVPENQSFSG